jgi:hypothetical protein
MAANRLSAPGTAPFFRFLYEELLDTMVPQILQILDRTQVEIFSITLIQMVQSGAGKILAFITVLDFPVGEPLTILFQVGAFPVPGPAPGAVSHIDSLAPNIIFASQIPAAHSTVYPAGGYQLIFHLANLAFSRPFWACF